MVYIYIHIYIHRYIYIYTIYIYIFTYIYIHEYILHTTLGGCFKRIVEEWCDLHRKSLRLDDGFFISAETGQTELHVYIQVICKKGEV